MEADELNEKPDEADEKNIHAFPIHSEIVLPKDDIAIEISDEESNATNENSTNKILRRQIAVKSEQPDYAMITIPDEKQDSKLNKMKSNSPESQNTPSSIYAVGGSSKYPKLELKSREVSTRQCKFDIGEEWEQFQTIQTTQSISCPPSPLIGRTHDDKLTGRNNPGYAASEPGAEIDQDLTDASEKAKDPFPFHYLFSTTSANQNIKEHHIIPNPFNKVNQRFHSTLQCPCFLFFFFLCCLPAVHLMQQSDKQFTKGNAVRARKYGKVSTICYIVGSIVGVVFLSVAIYFAADYVSQFV
ncbi:hypothetical protein ACF0H5_009034 [Mactra antiquata]